jgi:hypothetical protein
MDVADIPTKRDLVRAGKFARVLDPVFDFAAAEFNALRDGILALREGSSVLGTDEIVYDDELDEIANGGGWFVDGSNGGQVVAVASADHFGFPSTGVAALILSTTSGSKVDFGKPAQGMLWSDARALVYKFRASRPGVVDGEVLTFTPTADGAPAGGRWAYGIAAEFTGDGPTVAVALLADIDGSNNRSWSVAIANGAPPTPVPITMPAGLWFEGRITLAATGITVEISPLGGAWVTVFTSSATPPSGVYVPFFFGSKDSGAGGDTVIIDRESARCSRTGHNGTPSQGFTLGGVPSPATSSPQPVSDGGGVTGTSVRYAREDHVHQHGDRGGGTEHAQASSGSAGFMSASDKAKLDTIDAGDVDPAPTNVVGAWVLDVQSPQHWTWTRVKNVITVSGLLRVKIDTGNHTGGSVDITLPSTPASLFAGGGHTLDEWTVSGAQACLSLKATSGGSIATLTFDLTTSTGGNYATYLVTLTYSLT